MGNLALGNNDYMAVTRAMDGNRNNRIDQSEANTPEKHAAYLKTELTRWSRVIAEAGVKAE